MNTALDCIPCLLRQALEAARMVSADPAVHEATLRDVLHRASEMDLGAPPPAVAQKIHRRLRQITGLADPYRAVKDWHNRLAAALVPELKRKIARSSDPLAVAVRLAIAGNVIDLGAPGQITAASVHDGLRRALDGPFAGDMDRFRRSLAGVGRILYLADNAGEIVFDRLLVEQLAPARVTVAVRGGPVINDATLIDARAAKIDTVAEVIENGSDAPGTILDDCSEEFRRRFAAAELIIAKGQGNFETLGDAPQSIFFLFKVKCPVIAASVGHPLGTQVLAASTAFDTRRQG